MNRLSYTSPGLAQIRLVRSLFHLGLYKDQVFASDAYLIFYFL
jgi:hypothetical protein